MIFDYLLNEDIVYHRKKSNRDIYVMRLDDTSDAKEEIKSALFFSHISKELYYMTPAKSRSKKYIFIFYKRVVV